MFAKWFGTRSHRRSAEENRFRPQLEYLEGRLAPSSLMPADHGHGNGNGNGNGHGDNGGGPPGHVNNNGNVHINNHDNFNIHITNSFDAVTNTLAVNGTLGTFGTPVSVLEQELFAAFGQVLQSGGSLTDAITLVRDEFQLGQLVGQLVNGILAGQNPSIPSQVTDLENAIQQNSVEDLAAGQQLGALAFDIGLDLSLPQLQGQQSS